MTIDSLSLGRDDTTPDQLSALDALRLAAQPWHRWGPVQMLSRSSPEYVYLDALVRHAHGLMCALSAAWRERDELAADLRSALAIIDAKREAPDSGVADLREQVEMLQRGRASDAAMRAELWRVLKLVQAEAARLRSMLNRAHHSLAEGFVGGEWAASVPEEVCYAAAREHDEAVELIAEIRRELGLDAPAKAPSQE